MEPDDLLDTPRYVVAIAWAALYVGLYLAAVIA